MGLLVFLMQLFIASGIGIEEGIIFISSETPDQVKYLYSDAGLLIDVSLQSFDEIYLTLEMQTHLFMVDVTWTKSYLGLLNFLSESFGMAYFTPSIEPTKFAARFSLHNTDEDEAYSISSLLAYLKVENYVLLSSANRLDQKSSKFLNDITHSILNSHITYPEELPLSVAEDIIGKMVKAKGIKAIVIIDSSNSLSIIEQAMISKKYIKPGTIIVYSSKSFNHGNTNGAIKIEELMTGSAKNLYEFDYFALINRLSKAQFYIENTLRSAVNKENLILTLTEFAQDKNLYSVINIQNSLEILVGKIYKTELTNEFQCEINSTIYFPGNITQITSMKTKLLFSITNGTNDPYYSFNYPILAYYYQGANYAVEKSNKNNEIDNFYIELFPTDCGIFWYDPYWYQSCYGQVIDNMGVAMISSFFGGAIKGNILTMRAFNKVIPQISPLGGDTSLDNKNDYPEVVKLEAKSDIYILSRLTTLMSLGYTDIILLSSNETEELKERVVLYKYLITSSGMKIINDEDHMYIQYNYSRTDYNKYIDIFQYLKDTRCTVYFIVIYFTEMVIEALYDVGLRKGDFVFISDSSAVTYLDGIEEPYATKRRELVQGALVLSYREYIGDYGNEIKNELLQMFPDVTYMCMTFDTVSVIKEAIIYLLSTGDDYEDYNKLMNAIRKNKIVGCLGNVFFDVDGNTRASSQYLIQQIYYNSTSKVFGSIDISYLDRFSSQLITIINPYIWPINSAPPNYRPYSACPFDSYKIQSSSKGKIVLYSLSALYFIICLVSCIVTFLKFERKISPIIEEKNVSFDDYIYFLYFPLQFFQIIAMGPDQLAYKKVIKNFETIFSFDFNLYFNFEFDKFWYLFYFVFGFSIFWILGCLLFWSKIGSSMSRFWLTNKITVVYKLIVPMVGHLGFMPIISMLMNIYLCIEGTSDAISDSFLNQDCTVMCYQNKHKIIAALTCIILAFFIPLAVFNRPLWETTNESLHLQTKSNYLIVISLSQICLVLLNKTFKLYNQVYHGILCSCIIFALLIFTIFYKPYNYARAAVSQCISLTASLWALITATIFRENSSLDTWIIVEIVGLLLVLIAGFAVFKKFPQLLVSEKGIDISTLFLFQFCKNYEKFINDPKSLGISMSEEKYMMRESKSP